MGLGRSDVDLEGVIVGGEGHKHDQVMKMYFITKYVFLNDRTVAFLIKQDRQR